MRYLFYTLFFCLWFSAAPAVAIDPLEFCKDISAYTPIAGRSAKAVLFVVTDCKVTPNYLLGTLHTDDPRVISRTEKAFTALAKSRMGVFELVDMYAIKTAAQDAMVLQPESPGLREIAGEEMFQRLVTLLQQRDPLLTEEAISRLRPWAASVMLDMPRNISDGRNLDTLLEEQMRSQGKDVRALETVHQQFAAFDVLTQEQQIALLEHSMSHMVESANINERLKAYYIENDLDGIYRLGEAALLALSPDIAAVLRKGLITDRNARMGPMIAQYFAYGNIFTAVGALHLPGEDGILNQLEAAGFYLFPVE